MFCRAAIYKEKPEDIKCWPKKASSVITVKFLLGNYWLNEIWPVTSSSGICPCHQIYDLWLAGINCNNRKSSAPGPLLSRGRQHSHAIENSSAKNVSTVWSRKQSISGFIFSSLSTLSSCIHSDTHRRRREGTQWSKEKKKPQKVEWGLTLTRTPGTQLGSLLDLWWELQLVWPELTQRHHVHQTGSPGLGTETQTRYRAELKEPSYASLSPSLFKDALCIWEKSTHWCLRHLGRIKVFLL